MAITEKQVRESLEAQLKAKGSFVPHFQSLIDDYIFYWKTIKKFEKDVRKRGLYYEEPAANRNVVITKENPSVKLIPQYTKAMLQILKDMQLTVDQPIADEDDEL